MSRISAFPRSRLGCDVIALMFPRVERVRPNDGTDGWACCPGAKAPFVLLKLNVGLRCWSSARLMMLARVGA